MRPSAASIGPSPLLENWVPAESSIPGKCFRDSIVVRSSASATALLGAVERVRGSDMPLAMLLGGLRYLPARFGAGRARRAGADSEQEQPFVQQLYTGLGSVLLARTPSELIIGTIGKLHQIRDQEIVAVPDGSAFLSFAEPNHEKLAMSLRVGEDNRGAWVVLEHRTRATDAAAERRFARYWRVIRPAGAFVTRQLLNAAARLAESEHAEAEPARTPARKG
jgi:hypothetical protein